MSNLALNFDKPVTPVCDPGHVMPAKTPTDCILKINLYSGFAADHNGRCPNAACDPNPHLLDTTHHVRVNGSCLECCSNCAMQYTKRRDAIVREL
jgi:hypothetical protein